MDTVLILGYIAATLTTLSFLPQAIRIIKLRETRDISLIMYIMLTTGVFCWMVYGFLNRDYPIVVANLITFILAATVLGLKVRYR